MTNTSPSTTRKVAYALTLFLLGVWTFIKTNAVSGPAFEPIIEACTNPDFANPEEFASKTGYHIYEPKVGLGIFNFLVCLITQFLLELRQTYPAGLLTWGSIIVVTLPANVLLSFEPGRIDAKKWNPISFPIIIGLFFQLIGVSVAFPLLWAPSYVFGSGMNGPVSSLRANLAVAQVLPGIVLTMIAFAANIDSYLWTVSVGILGGPLLVMSGVLNWFDVLPPITKESVANGKKVVRRSINILMTVSIAFWYSLVFIAFQTYDSFGSLWKDIWTDANASVAFMTIDAGILYVAIMISIAFQSEAKALKGLLLTPLLGPGAAPLKVLKELEMTKLANVDFEKKEI